ncbi:hypothetical protein KFE25_000421 [Diacronema lutheri]|uniref:Uncharacterized protein n=1 Tax=Diacronema lutheri TaxID=2081491 RepID=A0A8J6CEP2_DIALT|nr:hypothetical protein KFE25_000421 [Diacronema lutheri]
MAAILAAGASACVHSLQGRPELNGEIVTLVTFDEAAARWVCRTADGGRVALRNANLQPVRNAATDGLARAPMRAPAWAQSIASLPWAHFAGGLCITLLAGYLFRGSAGGVGAARATRGGASRGRPSHASSPPGWSFSSPLSGAAGAFGSAAITPYLPFAALLGAMGVVWALFVDAGGGTAGTPLQRQVRTGLARAVGAASSLANGLSAFQLAILAVGLLLSWSLFTEQLRLELNVSQLVMLPIVGYTLWRSRGNLHDMNPFQLLWLLDIVMRMFRPTGHQRGGYGGGYGGGRRRMFF